MLRSAPIDSQEARHYHEHGSAMSAGLLVLLFALGAAATPPAGDASIDWNRRVVRCTGVGAPSLREETENIAVTRIRTERAARREAVHGCLRALRAVPFPGRGDVGAALDADRALAAKVLGAVRRFRVPGGARYHADGGVRLDAEVPLDGALSELLPPLRRREVAP